MRENEEGQSADADGERPAGPLPVQYVVDAMLAPLVQSTGRVVRQREEQVEHDEERAPPEAAQLQRHAGQPEVHEHEHAVAHVDHDVEGVHVVDARVVHEAPVGDGHAEGETRGHGVEEPVDLLHLAVLQLAGVKVRLALQPPAARDEDRAEEGLREPEGEVPVRQVDRPLLHGAEGRRAAHLQHRAQHDAQPEEEDQPAVDEVPGLQTTLAPRLRELPRLRRLELGVEPFAR